MKHADRKILKTATIMYSIQNWFNATDIESIREFAENVLQDGDNRHFFCSAIHFVSCEHHFCARTAEIKDSVAEIAVLEVRKTPLFNSCELYNNLRNQRLKRPRRNNVVEKEVNF